MNKSNKLTLIGCIILGLTPVLSAQTNMVNLIELDHTTAYVSKHGSTHFTKHHDVLNTKMDHDTVRYLVVVDATDHLNTDEVNKTEVVTEHTNSESHGKHTVISAIDHIFTNNSILFGYRDHKLSVESMKVLDKVAEVMVLHPHALFELGAHTDSRGVYEDNMILSQKRVDSAINYLLTKGVSKDQIISVAYGETVLKNVCDSDSHCSEEIHASNRRIEIKILSYGK
jgi:outer membrane protein OmpA-like peptidoglycan-associated protein